MLRCVADISTTKLNVDCAIVLPILPLLSLYQVAVLGLPWEYNAADARALIEAAAELTLLCSSVSLSVCPFNAAGCCAGPAVGYTAADVRALIEAAVEADTGVFCCNSYVLSLHPSRWLCWACHGSTPLLTCAR